MRTFNIHETKTHLSRLVDEAEQGDSFVIAKAGKPKVKVVRIDAPEAKPKRRIGFLKGRIKVPDDFDTMFADEIEKTFSGES
jgi:prevent-host-death family protein